MGPNNHGEDLKTANNKMKSNTARKGLGHVIQILRDFVDLATQTARGDYKELSYRSFGIITAAIAYFVLPVDAIPDLIGPLGFTDDAAVLVAAYNCVEVEVLAFQKWKANKRK